MRLSVFIRTTALAAVVAMAQAVAAPAALAHAVIIESSPAVGAVIAPGDFDVTLRYNSRIDHPRSRLTLIGANGESHLLAIAPDSAPDVITARMSDLVPGQYRLRWQVLAIDGHLTRGDIPFSVKAP